MRLFAYKQTHDTGFAPNPFHGVCTLATCKPLIRLHKRPGDWIAGVTSATLNGDPVGSERLIYLMQVETKLPLEEYHAQVAYRAKIPVMESERCVETVGDNICGMRDGEFFQVPNRSHGPEKLIKDLSGRFVLISRTFAYFGGTPLVIPGEIRPEVPTVQAGHGVRTDDPVRAQAFIDYVMSRGIGVHAQPTQWKRNDDSWQGKRRPCG